MTSAEIVAYNLGRAHSAELLTFIDSTTPAAVPPIAEWIDDGNRPALNRLGAKQFVYWAEEGARAAAAHYAERHSGQPT